MSLTTEQLKELTERINARLSEFEMLNMPKLSRGVVRIAQEEIMRFWDEDVVAHALPWPQPPAPTQRVPEGELMLDGYYIGLQRGREEAARANGYEVAPEPTPEPPAIYANGHYAPEPEPAPNEPTPEDDAPLPAIDDPPAEPALSRAAVETLGPEHVTVTPIKPKKPRAQADAARREATAKREADRIEERNARMREIIDAIRAMSVDGKMPTIMQWDLEKPAGMTSWSNIQRRHNVASWRALAALCGLEYRPGRGFTTKDGTAQEQPAEEPTYELEDDDDMVYDPPQAKSGSGYKRTPEQLATLRERRAAARKQEQARKPAKPAHRTPGSFVAIADTQPAKPQVTREQLLAEVRQIAMGGHMPTMSQFDLAKPAVWPNAATLVQRFNTTWQSLSHEAGLKWERVPRTIHNGELQPAG